MHCSPKQQRIIATMLIEHLGDQLMTYDALCATGRPASLSPLDLRRKVLVKGKIKFAKVRDERHVYEQQGRTYVEC